MPFFTQAAAAALQDRTLRCALLVYLGFRSEPIRVWLGYGRLTAGGWDWSGLGELGSVSNIEVPLGGTAPVTTLGLSGVDPSLVSKALDASWEVKGRPAVVSLQLFGDDWQTLDQPYALLTGTQDQISAKGTAPTERQISVTVEWLFTRRAISPFAMLSDRDQKALFPGDRGLEQVAAMQNKSTEWPSF